MSKVMIEIDSDILFARSPRQRCSNQVDGLATVIGEVIVYDEIIIKHNTEHHKLRATTPEEFYRIYKEI